MLRCLYSVIFLGLLAIHPICYSYSSFLQPEEALHTILVEKKKHLMTVFHRDAPVRKYRIALGFSPEGHKIKEGDGKTPEGTYTIIAKNPKSLFHLSLKLSYPSKEDEKTAKERGVSPGGEIMIHGLGPQASKGKWHVLRDWTQGCIAITNEEIEELFHFAQVGTKVYILP